MNSLLAVLPPQSQPQTRPILVSQPFIILKGQYEFVLNAIEDVLQLFGIKFLRQRNFFECISPDNFEEEFNSDFEVIVIKKQYQVYEIVIDDFRQRSLSTAPMPPPPSPM